MALVCPDLHGEILLLQYIVGCAQTLGNGQMGVDDNPVLHLYGNNVTPSDSTVIGDLTQVTSAGYAPITLTSSNWTIVQTGGGITSAVYTEKTFAFITNATAYGYYVTNEANQLLWLEQFSGAPFNIPDGGGTISITTKLTLS